MNPDLRPTLIAICDRLVPKDRWPSASEVNIPTFLEELTLAEGFESIYDAGLAAVDQVAQRQFGKSFASLEPAKQDTILSQVEGSEFFQLINRQVTEGYYASPESWPMIGFEVTG